VFGYRFGGERQRKVKLSDSFYSTLHWRLDSLPTHTSSIGQCSGLHSLHKAFLRRRPLPLAIQERKKERPPARSARTVWPASSRRERERERERQPSRPRTDRAKRVPVFPLHWPSSDLGKKEETTKNVRQSRAKAEDFAALTKVLCFLKRLFYTKKQ
jgi:hypothetical protein